MPARKKDPITQRALAKRRTSHQFCWKIDSSGTRRYVLKGADPDLFIVGEGPTKWVYDQNRDVANKVLGYVTEGMTLGAIGRIPGMPPASTLYAWVAHHRHFKMRYETAKQNRGLVMEDRALDVAESSTPQTVSADRLKIDTYKWSAEVNTPETYAKQTKVNAELKVPVTIVVNTGIKRIGDEAIEVESAPVSEAPGEVGGIPPGQLLSSPVTDTAEEIII